MLNKKQIQVIFLFKFKMGRKAVETTCNINNAFGPGTATKRTMQQCFKEFAKEERALKTKGEVAYCWKSTITNWDAHRRWSSYNYTRSCWRTQCQPFYSHLASEANWKGGKSWSVDPHDPNGRKQRGTKEPLDEGERGEWKSWLKTQHSKTKIMASGPITSW